MLIPRRIFDDFATCLAFYTRLPVKAPAQQSLEGFAEALGLAPLAGAVVGAIGGGVFICVRALGLTVYPAAGLSVLALVMVCGGLHEDGLADVADGFGGGATRERKLEIMRDSRVGTYGVLALVFSVLLRVLPFAALGERSPWLAFAGLVAAGGASRLLGLAPLLAGPPARTDGAGAAMPRPTSAALGRAAVLAVALALLPVVAGEPLRQIVVANFAAFVGVMALTRLSQRQIGGYSGDVLGAAQQIAEVAILLSLSAG
jgi:adenosylcobinamide-GDP ribazoletransferase